MHERLNLRRGAAMVACAASLAGGAAAVAPGAASAQGAQSCGAKTITVPQKNGKALHVSASRIEVEGGATCKQAYAVIRGVVTQKVPSGWKVRGGHGAPQGLNAEVATKGGMTVKFDLVGS